MGARAKVGPEVEAYLKPFLFFSQEKLCQIFLPFVIGGVGLVFYISRFPEKIFKAGSVDILGSSHQVNEK